MSSAIASFFSSFVSTSHADSEQEEEKPAVAASEEAEAPADAEKQDEEEEEEPEDTHPVIREECKQSAKCAALTKHFEHCQEKVHAGEGLKGEDCVEELMMHCVDNCAAPKLFANLK